MGGAHFSRPKEQDVFGGGSRLARLFDSHQCDCIKTLLQMSNKLITSYLHSQGGEDFYRCDVGLSVET